MTPTQLDEDRTQAALDSREGCCGMDSPAARRRRELSPAVAMFVGATVGLGIWLLLSLLWTMWVRW